MVDKEHCTGCSACAMSCHTEAISMYKDKEGFLYPRIDMSLCVQCGKCEAACPVSSRPGAEAEQMQTFMLRAKEKELVRSSSSGGAFSLLAQQFIRQGGVVVGCAMSKDCYNAEHILVETMEDLEKLKGSKYIQSVLGNTLRKTKDALDAGRAVLFSGTPCQISGLRRYLGKREYENLLTVDLLCHGAPSPLVWEKYLREMEKRYASKAVKVSFRDKVISWKKFSLTCTFADGSVYTQAVTEDPYLRGFVDNLYLRPSCYACAFKDEHYESDITLADFWGVERCYPDKENDGGVSLAITHTKKGSEYLALAAEEGHFAPVTVENALASNHSYYKSVPPNAFRARALREMERMDAVKVIEKYCGASLDAKVRRKIAKIIGHFKRSIL